MENMEIFFLYLGHLVHTTVNVIVYEEVYKLAAMTMIKMISHLPET